ncbi:MAG TPA: hypothetical protein VFF06_11630, partial [Polyangia bacterium]|nr:hypothetical protein [Polyangia bacterium]
MKTRIVVLVVGLAWSGSALADPDPDLNAPAMRAWTFFAQINSIAAKQSTVKGQKTNDALWETWADDPATFPSDCKTPVWPGAAPSKKLRRSLLQLLVEAERSNKKLTAHDISARPFIEVGGTEEVRRNKASFDFIVKNGLWYVEGIERSAGAAIAGYHYPTAGAPESPAVAFPVDAIEVKANWKPITAADKPNYHWNLDSQGNLFGLVAMHLITKSIPMWTWATFEHVDNPARCDHIGCYDPFGAAPAYTATNGQICKGYAAGALTPALVELLKKHKVPAEFQHYRLKGTQTSFIDQNGFPTLLANSVTECGGTTSCPGDCSNITSSCMTCHALARADAQNGVRSDFVFSSGPTSPAKY